MKTALNLLCLLGLTALPPFQASASARPDADRPRLYYTEIVSDGVYRFSGDSPTIDADLIAQMREKARSQASLACNALVGSPTIFEKTGEGDFSFSILSYHMELSFLCGRAVRSSMQVIPSLIDALTNPTLEDEIGINLNELAGSVLLQTGNSGALALIDEAVTLANPIDRRIHAIQVLDKFHVEDHGLSADLFRQVHTTLLNLAANDDDGDLRYEATLSYGKSPHAAKDLRNRRSEIAPERYAQLVYAIVQHFDLTSYYTVKVDDMLYLLRSDDSYARSMGLHALTRRRYSAEEFEVLLPALANLASPASGDFDGTIFRALGVLGDERAIPLYVDAIKNSFLADQAQHSFVFQAMLQLQNHTSTLEAQRALPELRLIAASDVNPSNRYLQILAAKIIDAIEDAAVN